MLFVPCFYTGACGVAVGYPFDTVKVCLLQNHFHLRQSSVSRKSFTELDALCLCVRVYLSGENTDPKAVHWNMAVFCKNPGKRRGKMFHFFLKNVIWILKCLSDCLPNFCNYCLSLQKQHTNCKTFHQTSKTL